ncbi:MAG: glycosyltransferase family 4 protein [Syntrophomonas sp.]
MSNKYIAIMGIALVFISFSLTWLVRQYTLRKQILDIPNERSSHDVVTPRGGGLGFVIIFLFCLCILWSMGLIELNNYLALVGGGVLIAVVGWTDDKNGLTQQVRSFFHFLAAAWAVYCLGGFSVINVGFTNLHLSWVGSIVAVIGTVWMINLYNFMDGVDGIAGTEAVSVAVMVGLLLLWQQSFSHAIVCFLLAASVMGFLIWNWPPAKIFMGDVGSGFLGYIFAVMAMWSEQSEAIPLIIWMLLLGVFVIDATVTLVKRMRKGEKLYEAHRSHVYQLAVQAGYSHKQVTDTVLLINVLLGIIAIGAVSYSNYSLGISLGTAIVLIIIHCILGKVFNKKINVKASTIAYEDLVIKQSYNEAAALRDE